jgi:hypothetical protein
MSKNPLFSNVSKITLLHNLLLNYFVEWGRCNDPPKAVAVYE